MQEGARIIRFSLSLITALLPTRLKGTQCFVAFRNDVIWNPVKLMRV